MQLFTYQNNEEQTLKEVIKGVIDLLPSAIIIDSQQVVQKLFKRINQSPVGIPHSRLALVHASSSAVRKAYVAVCQLQTAVKMKAMDYNEIKVKDFCYF
ncbi:PTS sugar transporter subunit IIA [Lactobacillus sp. R2/2]|nr:PTS sugar transporter subunit IIA [Lactobacillus sp. R2/2]